MYFVEIQVKALKQIETLSRKDQQKIFAAIERLKADPCAGKQLQGAYKGLRSLRVWTFRIVYFVDHHTVTVTVVRVGQRKSVYR